MIEFIAFALYICVSCLFAVMAPIMMVPNLPMRRKLWISAIGFLIFVPFSLLLYYWLGAPQLANA